MNRASTILVLLLLTPISGCVTPVIPLPPPDPVGMSLTVDAPKGEVVVSGKASKDGAHHNALVYFFNVRTGLGTIAQTSQDGSFTTEPLKAQDGDQLDLWTSRFGEDEPSSVVCVTVDYASGSLPRCP